MDFVALMRIAGREKFNSTVVCYISIFPPFVLYNNVSIMSPRVFFLDKKTRLVLNFYKTNYLVHT